MKIIVVGCGISGISAVTLLSRAGHGVEIFETRDHIGGNCYDETIHGVTIHKYGPHLFHTNDSRVWRFLSEFSSFSDYRHRVVADTRLGRISISTGLHASWSHEGTFLSQGCSLWLSGSPFTASPSASAGLL